MIYRIRQLCQAIKPRINKAEIDWALSFLPPSTVSVFFDLPESEQRHALDVAYDLWSANQRDLNLLIAAFLHDCGKSRRPLMLWERIYIVLVQKLPHRVWNALLHSHSLLSAPLLTAQEHPLWGAELALKLGLNAEVIELIRNHHSPKTLKETLLQEADNRH